MKHAFALAALSVLMLSLPAHAEDKPQDAGSAAGKDYVMIKVEGQDVKRSEVEEAWKTVFQSQGREAPQLDSFDGKDRFLREVASEYVLYKQAKKEGLEDSPEVKATLEKLKRQVIIQQLLKEKTKDAVSDEKLKAAYDTHIKASEGTSAAEEFNARHILVKTKDEADAVEKKLKKGEDFVKLAKEKSQDPGSGAAGGDLGWFTPDKMVPEFSAALLKLKKGEISPPVKSDFGWHVIQLVDRRKPTPPPFSEVKEGLKQELGSKAMGDYVKSAMTNVTVTKLDAEGHETALPPEAPKKVAASGKGGKEDKDGAAE